MEGVQIRLLGELEVARNGRSVALPEFFNPRDYVREAKGIRIEHRSAAPRGETVTGEINYVDIGSPQRHAFF